MKVVALAGGVGGARLADGLAQALPATDLTVIVNTGDDFRHFGLFISPDIDTVCYTLAGLANPATGWGRADERFLALETIRQLNGPDWFTLGDRDLGLHLERTRRILAGDPLSRITQDFCQALGVAARILPMSDDPVPTIVHTSSGPLPFQEYFVQQRAEPAVRGFTFQNAEKARPAPGVLPALQAAEVVIFCPSNPWVSLDPILAVPGIRQAVAQKPVIAVSPIIGGKTVKGPAAKMYAEMGIQPSALAVAKHYNALLQGFVLDTVDATLAPEIAALGVRPLVRPTWMKTPADRLRLAKEILQFAHTLTR